MKNEFYQRLQGARDAGAAKTARLQEPAPDPESREGGGQYFCRLAIGREAGPGRCEGRDRLITGQKPAETRSKKSIANFKLRQDQAIGAKVTLRGDRMYEFLERLIKTALPRIRDFRGVSPRPSTATATTPSAFPTSRFSPKSNSTRSSATSVSTLRSSPPRGRTKRRSRS